MRLQINNPRTVQILVQYAREYGRISCYWRASEGEVTGRKAI